MSGGEQDGGGGGGGGQEKGSDATLGVMGSRKDILGREAASRMAGGSAGREPAAGTGPGGQARRGVWLEGGADGRRTWTGSETVRKDSSGTFGLRGRSPGGNGSMASRPGETEGPAGGREGDLQRARCPRARLWGPQVGSRTHPPTIQQGSRSRSCGCGCHQVAFQALGPQEAREKVPGWSPAHKGAVERTMQQRRQKRKSEHGEMRAITGDDSARGKN